MTHGGMSLDEVIVPFIKVSRGKVSMGEKTIGLFRAIKPEWLNKTAELVIDGYDSTTIKAMLDDYLSYEIESSIVFPV